jgi:hypothetical protein
VPLRSPTVISPTAKEQENTMSTLGSLSKRVAMVLLAALATAVALLPASPKDASAAACSARYVAVVKVIPYGTSLYALYHTGAPAKAWFTLYKPGTKEILTTSYRMSWHQGTTASPAALGTPSGVPLEPGTKYDFVLTAEDTGGCRYYARGTASTLRRLVQVTFDRIQVADDGDNNGSGELNVDLRLHDKTEMAVLRGVTLTAPGTLNPRSTLKLVNAPTTLKAYTRVSDDDYTWGLDHCSDAQRTWGNGSNRCWDWATAVTTITVPDKAQTRKGSFTSYAKGGTAFSVTGSWRVSYIP